MSFAFLPGINTMTQAMTQAISKTKENDMHHNTDDLIHNPSTRCPCMLVLDTSASMSGEPINELNDGLLRFVQSTQQDESAAYSVELGIISAGGSVREIMPFTCVADIREVHAMQASGNTPLGSAVSLALQRLDERKQAYKDNGVPYFQPWLVIISDGAPTDEYLAAANQARTLSANRKLVSLPIGVQGADLSLLGEFSSKPALPLKGLHFGEFFEWLSQSMSRVSGSNSSASDVQLPSVSPWTTI